MLVFIITEKYICETIFKLKNNITVKFKQNGKFK